MLYSLAYGAAPLIGEVSMPTVMIEPDLYDRASQTAHRLNSSIEDVFAEAMQRYLWDLARAKISQESHTYRLLHAELKTKYLGQYIAMHDGQVVDHDSDFQLLRQRIRQRYGNTAVMMTRVEENGEPTLTRRGFRVER